MKAPWRGIRCVQRARATASLWRPEWYDCPVQHRVVLIRRTEIAVGMPCDDVQARMGSVERVEAAGRDAPAHAGLEEIRGEWCLTSPSPSHHYADPIRRVSVRRLICVGRDVEVIEAGLAPLRRTDKQGGRAAIEVP